MCVLPFSELRIYVAGTDHRANKYALLQKQHPFHCEDIIQSCSKYIFMEKKGHVFEKQTLQSSPFKPRFGGL